MYIHIYIYVYLQSLCPQVDGNGLESSVGGEDSLSGGSWQDKSPKIDRGIIREDLWDIVGSELNAAFRCGEQ